MAEHKSDGKQPDEDAITASLLVLRDEIELIKARLADKGCPSELYESYLRRVRNLASPTISGQPWKSHKAGLPSDVRLALAWAAWFLPSEEDELTPDKWSSLMSELDAVEQSVDASGLSPYVREFILRQINLIRTALRHYGIAGIAPVESALEQTYGALTKNRSILEAEAASAGPEGKTLLKKFTGAIHATAKAAETVDKLQRGGVAIAGITKWLLEYLK